MGGTSPTNSEFRSDRGELIASLSLSNAITPDKGVSGGNTDTRLFWRAINAQGFLTLSVVRLPIFQVGLAAEDDSDAASSEADVEFAPVPRPMLLQPLRKPRIVPGDAFQLNGPSHVLFLDALDHCTTSAIRAGM
jgi:hypothetical protein